MIPESKTAALARVAAIFRRMLATGNPVAIADGRRRADLPEGFRLGCLGVIPRQMKEAGEIRFAGYRQSQFASRHCVPDRLWVLADAPTVKPEKGVARG